MPIYEYTCQTCNTSFEMIRRFEQADTDLKCVKYQGVNLTQRMALFPASSRRLVISDCNNCPGES